MAKADYHIEQMRSTKELLLLLKKKRMYANAYISTCVLREMCVTVVRVEQILISNCK
jgi:hypothetical protein